MSASRRRILGTAAVLVGVAGLVAAALLAANGQVLAATKLSLFLLLFPALLVCGALFLASLGSAFTIEGGPLGSLAIGGLTVFGAAFVLWLPFSPDRWRWHLGEMPVAILVPMFAGVGAVAIASAGMVVTNLVESIKARNAPRAIGLLAVSVFLAWIVVEAFARRAA